MSDRHARAIRQGAGALGCGDAGERDAGGAELKDARAAAVDGSDGASAAARAGSHISTLALKPPKIIRLPSKGIDLGFIIEASRGSFITFAFTRSRSLRDL